MSNPKIQTPVLEYQSTELARDERRARGAIRALMLFGCVALLLTLTQIVFIAQAGVNWKAGVMPALVLATLTAGCFATIWAIRHQSVILVGIAAGFAWLAGIALLIVPITASVKGPGQPWALVLFIDAVFVLISVGIFALAWGLTSLAQQFRCTRQSPTQFVMPR